MNGKAITSESGFTVIEALVALGVLSVVLVSIYGASGTALRGVERAQGTDRAIQLAESKLAELGALRTVLPDTSKGTFPGTGVDWRVEAKDLVAGDGGPVRVQDVHLELIWSEGNARKTLAVDTRHLGWMNK